MKKIIGNILLLLIVVIISFVIYFSITGYTMYKQAIDKVSIKDKIEEIQKKENYVKIEDIPDYYWKAVVAVEDKRFFNHGAIDLISTITAVASDLFYKDFAYGGSTITQQLAKNLYFTQEKKLERKVAELFVATDIEKLYSKEEILEIYMNIIYYGDGYYGIYDACKGYFNKLPKELDIYEATILAGIPNAPSVYALTKGNKYTYQRQKKIIDCMAEVGYLSKEEADEIKSKKMSYDNKKLVVE